MKRISLKRILPLALIAAAAGLAAGCGLGETAMSAATAGVGEAEQAKQAKATEDRVKEQVESASSAAEAAQQEAIEKQGQ